jgi:MFS family permease
MAWERAVQGPFAALQHRDFRLFWAGQALSLVGTRMQAAALLWHIYQLTESPFALGYVGLARVIPVLIFALIGGVVADALDRRRLMIVSQSVLGLVAAGIGAWTLLGLTSVWPLYAVAALSAGVMAFDGPARQSLVPSLVPREHLQNAVGLYSLTSQLASIAGPALMGVALHYTNSLAAIYYVNAVSFLAVIAALLMMSRNVEGTAPEERPPISLAAALDGLRFVRHHRLLVSLMLLDFVATFFSSATTLLPIYAREILHVQAQGYGWLVAAPSVGALFGALLVAGVVPSIRRQGIIVLWAVGAYGAATVLFGLSTTFLGAFLALAGTGAADTVSTVLRQTIRQLSTPDALRGRMTSINMIFFQGGPQLGELEAGVVAGWLGAPFSVISGGVACLIAVAATAVAAPGVR